MKQNINKDRKRLKEKDQRETLEPISLTQKNLKLRATPANLNKWEK
jgi:hypothetical protein